jgi:hypothetical protein
MLGLSNPRDVLAFRVDFEDWVAVLVVLSSGRCRDRLAAAAPSARWTRPMTLGGPAEGVA